VLGATFPLIAGPQPINLFAQFAGDTPPTVQVQFVAGSNAAFPGGAGQVNINTVSAGTPLQNILTLHAVPNPFHDLWGFAIGWRTADGERIMNLDAFTIPTSTAAVRIYAVYENDNGAEQHVVTFNLAGGNVAGNVGPITTVPIYQGQSVTPARVPQDPIRAGYDFVGWLRTGPTLVGGTLTNTQVGTQLVVSGLTYTAQWVDRSQPTATVTFEPGRGGGFMGSMEVNHDSFTLPTYAPHGFTAPTGETFAGWLVSGNATPTGAQSVGTVITINGNVTLTAQWSGGGVDPVPGQVAIVIDGVSTQVNATAGQPIAWPATVTNVTHEFSTATAQGRAFWGWFNQSALTESRGTLTNRPALGATPLDMATLTFTQAEIDAGVTLVAVFAMWGDADDDGAVTGFDFELLRQHLLGATVTFNQFAVDVDVDEAITGFDLDLMRRALLGATVVLGMPQ
jgi:uncharacterized repeat protein (TIGR02543 family)